MRYSQDFFKQRSFEVVWAVFRVAERVTRQQVRALLEEKALTYLSSKDLSSLEGLEEVVRLGFHIGEINDANAKVLQREINNLRLACNELMASESRQLASKTEEASEPTVDEIFSQVPIVAEDLPKLMGSLPGQKGFSLGGAAKTGNEQSSEKGLEKNPAMNPAINSQKADEMAARFRESFKAVRDEKQGTVDEELAPEVDSLIGGGNETDFGKSGNEESGNLSEQAEYPEKEVNRQEGLSGNGFTKEDIEDPESGNRQTIGFGEPLVNTENSDRLFDFYRRRKVIIELLEQRSMCRIKDIVAALPHVSERTLRYDIKSLVDKGVIERVGGGGPQSFLRIKKGL